MHVCRALTDTHQRGSILPPGGPPSPAQNSALPAEGWPLPKDTCAVHGGIASGSPDSESSTHVGAIGGGAATGSTVLGEPQRLLGGQTELLPGPNPLLLFNQPFWVGVFSDRLVHHMQEVIGYARDGKACARI